jgi:hypothetical protein
MKSRTRSNGTILLSGFLFTFAPLVGAQAQDVDVPGNLTMHDSTDATVGNILKEGVPFLHNYGDQNTFIGTSAGNFTMTGTNNTGSGFAALFTNVSGGDNTATGVQALVRNIDGDNNTATGFWALFNNMSGSNNTATGHQALYNNLGDFNTATGAAALFLNTNGTQNTATGTQALRSNTTGGSNTATGVNALYSNRMGNNNTASGVNALFNNGTGSFNTATGFNALTSNVDGINNTAIGAYALWENTNSKNTAVGTNALRSNDGASENTAIGFDALYNNSGYASTAVGAYALYNNSGGKNTGVGYGADVSVGYYLTNATAIGFNAIVDASDKIQLGNTNVTVVQTSGTMYAHAFIPTSDRNQKENLQPVDGEDVLNKMHELNLTSWNFIGEEPKQFRHYGPMAQDFFAAFGNDGMGTVGTPTSFSTTDIDGILMIATQALEKRTVEQEKEIAQLKARLEALERRGSEVAASVSAGF